MLRSFPEPLKTGCASCPRSACIMHNTATNNAARNALRIAMAVLFLPWTYIILHYASAWFLLSLCAVLGPWPRRTEWTQFWTSSWLSPRVGPVTVAAGNDPSSEQWPGCRVRYCVRDYSCSLGPPLPSPIGLCPCDRQVIRGQWVRGRAHRITLVRG